MTKKIIDFAKEQGIEKVLIVILDHNLKRQGWNMDEVEFEMTDLVKSCGGKVVGVRRFKIHEFYARNLIGDGKAEEVYKSCQESGCNTVILSYDLKGSQQRNLEEKLGVKTIDRTQLILDIFARRAKSREGKTQVELAQLEYLLPRLVGKGIELSRLGGGIGTLGPGETKLEMDRRRIAARIDRLKKELEDIAASRLLTRKKRKSQGTPLAALVGYTNAGKSTLMNTLTDAKTVTRDGLFTTLDSLSRQLELPNHQKIIVSDTVGFMHELPHHLIESFKTTLDEVYDADILLRVLDISQPNFRNLHEAVSAVLRELNVLDKPTIIVLNKIDQLEDRGWLDRLKDNFENAICISAKTGENIDQLLAKIASMLSSLYKEINIDIPISRMDLVNLAHEVGEVVSVKYYNDKINLRVCIPAVLENKFQV